MIIDDGTNSKSNYLRVENNNILSMYTVPHGVVPVSVHEQAGAPIRINARGHMYACINT